LLAPDERDRASRFHFDVDARRYTVGRCALRRLLGAYLDGCDPRDVAFSYGAHGKPSLASTHQSVVRFNVAHSGGVALMGFAIGAELGVDVERVHDLPDLPSVMRSSFAAGERQQISLLPEHDRLDAFFRCWTRKEAVLKALGSGLARPLDSFDVSVDALEARVLAMPGDAGPSDEWRLLSLLPAPGFVGAAAWRGQALHPRHLTYVD
jgi:4'-phosphopantetheinyl transferase